MQYRRYAGARLMLGGILLLAALTGGWMLAGASAANGSNLSMVHEVQRPVGGYTLAATNAVTATIWAQEVVTTQANIVFRGDALHFDRTGHPALVYAVQSSSTQPSPPIGTLYYARQEGTDWRIEEVDHGPVSLPTLAYDAQNQPHINYVRTGVLYLAERSDNGWNVAPIDFTGGYVTDTAIAARSDGSLGIAFTAPFETPPTLYYAQRTNGAWSFEAAVTNPQAAKKSLLSPAIALAFHNNGLDLQYDGAGRPHIAYINISQGSTNSVESLILVAKIAGEWQSTNVASGKYFNAHAISMGDDLTGFAAYEVYDLGGADKRVSVVPINASGNADLPVYENRRCSLAALTVYKDAPEILCRYIFSVDKGRVELWLERIVAGRLEAWRLEDSEAASAALAVNSQGDQRVAYYAPVRQQLVMLKGVQVVYPFGLHLPLIRGGIGLDAGP